ncbi:phasin family protein [Janthinobacterium agaricidamnosum]|nr:phasin family protein [Janthinobacterium agaricidamnosum]
MEVQLSFITDLSRKMYDTMQRVSALNLRLAQDLVDTANHTSQQMMTAKDLNEFASAATTQLHPASEKLRQYQQQMAKLMADSNVEISKTAETHISQASRSAAAVADEIVRSASAETEKATQRQRDVMTQMNEAARRGFDVLPQRQNGKAPPTH